MRIQREGLQLDTVCFDKLSIGKGTCNQFMVAACKLITTPRFEVPKIAHALQTKRRQKRLRRHEGMRRPRTAGDQVFVAQPGRQTAADLFAENVGQAVDSNNWFGSRACFEIQINASAMRIPSLLRCRCQPDFDTFLFWLDKIRGLEPVFFKVRAIPNPIHDRKQSWRMQGRQDPVPCSTVEIHALTGRGDEGARRTRRAALIRRDHDQKRVTGHRHEGLAALRMPFDKGDFRWPCNRLSMEDTDARTPFRSEVETGTVVEPAATATIDDPVGIPSGFENIAERREGLRREGTCQKHPAHAPSLSWSLSSAIRSTCRQASANSTSRSLSIRRWNASMIDAFVLSRTAIMKGNPNFEV